MDGAINFTIGLSEGIAWPWPIAVYLFLAGISGGAVAVARRAGAMNTIDTINHFFLNKEMFVAGSTYWNIAYRRLPGEAMKDEEGVANMKNLGQNIAWILNKIK